MAGWESSINEGVLMRTSAINDEFTIAMVDYRRV